MLKIMLANFLSLTNFYYDYMDVILGQYLKDCVLIDNGRLFDKNAIAYIKNVPII